MSPSGHRASPTPTGLRPPPPNIRLSVELTTLGLVVVFGGGGDLRSGRDRLKNARFWAASGKRERLNTFAVAGKCLHARVEKKTTRNNQMPLLSFSS